MPRLRFFSLALLLCLFSVSWAQVTTPKFQQFNYGNGLSDNKVNCVLKTSDGFLWIGTPLGLNRFDGFRIRNYYAQPSKPTALPNNVIEDLKEDGEGNLWVKTYTGYCIYNPRTDSFDRDVAAWMAQHGMKGHVYHVGADRDRNLWIESSNHEIYFFDFKKGKPVVVVKPSQQLRGQITDIATSDQTVLLVYNDGSLLRLDAKEKRIVEALSDPSHQKSTSLKGYRAFIDSHNTYWVFATQEVRKFDANTRHWSGFPGYIVNDVNEDKSGNILVATDHDGLLVVSPTGTVVSKMLNDPLNTRSLPDNTLECLFVDDLGLVWIGTYRMGLAMFYGGNLPFATLPLGDVCTMAEDHEGRLWLGTNDKGMACYDFSTRQLRHFGKRETGLGSDVVVAILCASDGSLWAGTFQGGLAHYQNGISTVYRQKVGGLADDNVWTLAELPDHRLAVGTLGGGLQILDPTTGRWLTFNTKNSRLPSDYISSLTLYGKDRLVIGHSRSISFLDLRSKRITNLSDELKDAETQHDGFSVNQVYCDSRGWLWAGTITGLFVIDLPHRREMVVDLQGIKPQDNVAAIAEDHRHTMWITTNDGVKNIRVKKSGDSVKFFVNAYGEYDGLQTRMFNKRSMLCLKDGRVLFGGIDGVNSIDPAKAQWRPISGKVVFSGLTIFNHVVSVGEEFNGHVVLHESLNESHRVVLRHNENNFFIELSSSNIGMSHHPRFLYRVKGLSKEWAMTGESQMGVKFDNLSPGHYELQVRLVDLGGNPQPEVYKLAIVVKPPFYFSVWAWLFYFVLFVALCLYVRRAVLNKRRETEERLELKKQKEVEEMKMVFFTNISHELRTPLSLILSPLPGMIEKESDNELVKKLKLIQRNARKLLDLVNQVLDLRRLMKDKEELHLRRGNVVSFTKNICDQFIGLTDKDITLTFHSSAEEIIMNFDPDKLGKIINNLLSNAFKFTPVKGRVDVSLEVNGDGKLDLKVADNGVGISDEDKAHLFERFYQGSANTSGGSGIGLNLVQEYTRMHGGTVAVADNPKGGVVFTVTLPINDAEVQGKGFVESKNSEAPENDASPNTPDNRHEPKYTVLVVDDNEDFLEFMQSELAGDYRVVLAHDGKDALYRIDEERPDIVLTDVMMPNMDGNELCRRIKADKATADLPVIMLTARLSEEHEKESRECGADDYVKKPFNMELLKLHIDHLLKNGKLYADGKLDPRVTQETITSEDEKFVAKVTAYIEKNLSDSSLSVEKMGQDLGMSRVKLYRRMVTVTGKTPSEMIRLVRLRHAEQLIRKSQLSVSEIAYRVGFSSHRYFTKCYKDLYGYLPSQYKRGEH